jgi:hypothetical protein
MERFFPQKKLPANGTTTVHRCAQLRFIVLLKFLYANKLRGYLLPLLGDPCIGLEGGGFLNNEHVNVT